MAPGEESPITWGDLEKGALKATFSEWVRDVIRSCFFAFLPLILSVGAVCSGIIIWYLEGIRLDIKEIHTSQIDMHELQSLQGKDILFINDDIKHINSKLIGLEEKIQRPK